MPFGNRTKKDKTGVSLSICGKTYSLRGIKSVKNKCLQNLFLLKGTIGNDLLLAVENRNDQNKSSLPFALRLRYVAHPYVIFCQPFVHFFFNDFGRTMNEH